MGKPRYHYFWLIGFWMACMASGRQLPASPAVATDSTQTVTHAGSVAANVAQEAFRLRLSGKARDAELILIDGLQSSPHDPEELYEAVRCAFYLFKFDSAQVRINRLLKIQPDNPRNYDLAALLDIYSGIDQMKHPVSWWKVPFTFRHSIKMYGKLLQLDPTDDMARVLLIKSYHRLPWLLGGSNQKARHNITFLNNANEFYRVQAEVEMLRPDAFQSRIDKWAYLVLSDPENVAAYDEFGREYLRANDTRNALRVYGALEKLDSNRVEHKRRLALYFLENMDYARARDYINQYLDHHPPVPTPLRAYALTLKARIEQRAGKYSVADSLMQVAHTWDDAVWTTSAPPPDILFTNP